MSIFLFPLPSGPAGTSLAVLVFCAGCSRITTLFKTELVREGLLYQVPVDQDQLEAFWGCEQKAHHLEVFPLTAYMDDVAVPVIADKAADILGMLSRVFEIAFSVFVAVPVRTQFCGWKE